MNARYVKLCTRPGACTRTLQFVGRNSSATFEVLEGPKRIPSNFAWPDGYMYLMKMLPNGRETWVPESEVKMTAAYLPEDDD